MERPWKKKQTLVASKFYFPPFFSNKDPFNSLDSTVEDGLRSRRAAYVFVVLVHFGFTVISLLIHDVDFGVQLFAQRLRGVGEERR